MVRADLVITDDIICKRVRSEYWGAVTWVIASVLARC